MACGSLGLFVYMARESCPSWKAENKTSSTQDTVGSHDGFIIQGIAVLPSRVGVSACQHSRTWPALSGGAEHSI